MIYYIGDKFGDGSEWYVKGHITNSEFVNIYGQERFDNLFRLNYTHLYYSKLETNIIFVNRKFIDMNGVPGLLESYNEYSMTLRDCKLKLLEI